MTTTEAMKLALEALNKNVGELRIAGARHILRTAIEQAEKQEPPVQFKCTVVDDQHPAGVPLEQWGTPPTAQRQWVGLTDEEIDEWTPEIHSVIQAIEAKLKEKNT